MGILLSIMGEQCSKVGNNKQGINYRHASKRIREYSGIIGSFLTPIIIIILH